MSDIINQNTEPLFIFDMPDDETLSETISVKGEKGAKGDPTKLSQLDNDTGFITKDASNLTNYYDKTETDTKFGGKLDKTTFNAYEIPSDFFTGDETISGTGSNISLDNTSKAAFKSMTIYGDTSQTGTPTPDSPKDVKVATGTQIVSIVGSSTQTYTIDLGDIELCKIGNYRDYIYTDNGKWYIHKEIDSYTFKGDATVDLYEYNTDGTNNLGVNLKPRKVDLAAFRKTSGATSVIYSDKFGWSTGVNYEGLYITGASQVEGGYHGNVRLYIAHSRLDDYDASLSNMSKVALVRDWLANNNLTVYYIRNRSAVSDEEITDDGIIAQLNAFAKAKSNRGLTGIAVSGDLPVVLSVEAFTGNWNGTISGLSAGVDNTYSKSEIDDTIGDVEREFTKHKVVFMPVSNTISADTAAGDCSAIITNTGKVVLIDTGAVHSYSLIKNELQKHNVEKIDYLIISHYHADHTGNIASLASDFNMAGTVYYIPKHSDQAVGVSEGSEESILTIAGSNTIIRPDSGDTLTVDDITITFFNCDQADVDYYDTQNTSVNNYSICCYAECGNNTFLFTGDIMTLAAQRIYNQGWLKKVDVEKVEHHGVIYGSGGMSDFNTSIRPEYGVVSASAGMLPLLAFNSSETNAVKIAQGTTLFGTMGSAIQLFFDQKDFSITDGRRVYANANRSATRAEIYVDDTYTGVSDGTSAKPFKNLLAALALARTYQGLQVRINVRSGYASDEEVGLFYCPSRLIINGSFTVKKISIEGGSVYFYGAVTITDTADMSVAIDAGANVRFETLNIAGDTTSATDDGRGLRVASSTVRITTLNISNRKMAFGLYRTAQVQVDAITGSNNTYGYVVTEGATLAVGTWAAGFATTREYKARYYAAASKSPFTHFSPNAIEALPTGADLDNYNVVGTYKSPNGTTTRTLVNVPTGLGYAFNLKVEPLNGINGLIQTITSCNLDHSDTGIFVRVYDESMQVWSAWQTVVTGTE